MTEKDSPCKTLKYGPCLLCKMYSVEYELSGNTQSSMADLCNFRSSFSDSITLRSDPFLAVNEVPLFDICNYFCAFCVDTITKAAMKSGGGQCYTRVDMMRLVDESVIYHAANFENESTPSDWAHLRRLRYKDFLKTHYWHTVRMYARILAQNKCANGCTNQCLQVHHKTYKHRGRELFHMDDLEVLCDECHTKAHGPTS